MEEYPITIHHNHNVYTYKQMTGHWFKPIIDNWYSSHAYRLEIISNSRYNLSYLTKRGNYRTHTRK